MFHDIYGLCAVFNNGYLDLFTPKSKLFHQTLINAMQNAIFFTFTLDNLQSISRDQILISFLPFRIFE